MSAQVEFTLRSSPDIISSPTQKPVHPQLSGIHLKKAATISTDGVRDEVGIIRPFLTDDISAVLLVHSGNLSTINADTCSAIEEVRRFEKGTRKPIFAILSLVHVGSYVDEAFAGLCKMVYTNGIDAILLGNLDSVDTIKSIKMHALGLRGRRVKILLDNVDRLTDTIDHVDGLIATGEFESVWAQDALMKQKLLFTRNPALTDSLNVDVVISPHDESCTPPTTVPSSPVSMQRVRSLSTGRSYLYAELVKFMTPLTRLIVALSDDGASAAELSVQSRLLAKSRFPLILGLSASESSCRYMGCLYGVVPLQMQSFISINSVVLNAIAFAKERGLVEKGDEMVIVLQPPTVSASTNQSCFDGVVQKRLVE